MQTTPQASGDLAEGWRLYGAGAYAQAVQLCRARLSRAPQDPDAVDLAALCLASMGETQAALDLHAQAVRLAPRVPAYVCHLGQTFQRLHMYHEATECFDIAAKLAPDMPEVALARAQCIFRSGEDGAVEALDAMLSRWPGDLGALREKGNVLLSMGRKAEGVSALWAALERAPEDPSTLQLLAQSCPPEDVSRLMPLLDRALAAPEVSAPVHFARAGLLLRDGDPEAACKDLANGNRIEAARCAFDLQQEHRGGQEIRALFSEPVAQVTTVAAHGPVPIFVVGMPRSGSTLIESILSAHSQVTDMGEIGELHSAVRRLSQIEAASQHEALVFLQTSYLNSAPVQRVKTPFAVDKYLGNYAYVGHILHAFPQARVLHIHRDPRAVAWSIYRLLFASGELPFAYSADDILGVHGVYRDLMAFWEESFPGRILHVDYETLVADPEAEIPALLASLGLPWEEACLSPHKVKRTVKTASKGQVTRKIYRGSSDAWREVAPYLPWLHDLPERVMAQPPGASAAA